MGMYKLIAVDPGRGKCGVAAMKSDGTVMEKCMCAADAVAETAAGVAARTGGVDRVVVGSGTGSAAVAEQLRNSPGLPDRIELAPEQNTTLEARAIYEREHPAAWPLRIIPRWLFAPPRDLDAYAAVAIGLRYLKHNPK